MAIYAVIKTVKYEGYSIPDGIFTTYEAAEKYCDLCVKNGYPSVEIFEYDQDVPGSGYLV